MVTNELKYHASNTDDVRRTKLTSSPKLKQRADREKKRVSFAYIITVSLQELTKTAD